MNEPAWDEILPMVARVPFAAWRWRHHLQKLWSQTGAWTGLGATRVVLTGMPGAGKTFLAEHLAGTASALDWQEPGASTSVESHSFSIGQWHRIIRIVPGQTSAQRTQGLDEAFGSEELQGVIHVVDWGYNIPRDENAKDFQRDFLLSKYGSHDLTTLRRENLERELEEFALVLRQIQDRYFRKKSRIWLALVATKADLYSGEIRDAQKYYNPYGSGQMAEKIRQLHHQIGSTNCITFAAPVAPYPGTLRWYDTTVRPQGLDVNSQKALSVDLLRRIAEAEKLRVEGGS